MSERRLAVPSAALVHQPVTDADGLVAAYTLHDIVPHQRPAPAAESVADEDLLDREYEQTDLTALGAGRPLLLQATRRVLTDEDESVVADLSAEQTEKTQVATMVSARHARGLRTS
ncbi:MAG: hypothetical protein LBU50_01525, partial [Cellulomonas sp.]|nr:hypothetical protein [Cellulomonas sp.]